MAHMYSVWHYGNDEGADGLLTLDAAVSWGRDAVRKTDDDEDNAVGIYMNGEGDRVAVVHRGAVIVNTGFGTSRWPDGFNEDS